jgi:hypothetical protein
MALYTIRGFTEFHLEASSTGRVIEKWASELGVIVVSQEDEGDVTHFKLGNGRTYVCFPAWEVMPANKAYFDKIVGR